MAGDWETKTFSVDELQREFMEQGISDPGEAARKAIELFTEKLSELLDDDWQVMSGDSTTVLLRKLR